VPNWIPLKTGVENEIGVTQSWELPEFWELNHVRPSACTPSTLLIPLHPGGIGRKILNRIAGDGNRPRSGGEQTPDDRASNTARSSGDRRTPALQLIRIVYERNHL
jgi:hypothetical protein